ncbi:hypothetical protein [Vibrio europaeus]|jgi:hypothetical protein|uniref:Uncharacterized protein n=1 Tax=Vibrio europaeus TaxID=300876 RepID=A0ABT5GN97_9VIBR|nr:hypothetical protein [Vibrio europaeus]MDC5718300.1 hypothetical protein [Vibrio europaeus]MDC5723127.1 hypothetical protein [Vibrio europaeus]MDC5728084.1 hypothetical protein [Vibrio europaeus]MDC5733387.1 hypothetical protein [Vibrio europaeus]MDC5738574.1 hypothetical protein [Vibrio europaeus]
MSESETSKESRQERESDIPTYAYQVDRRYVGWDEFRKMTDEQ